MKSYKEALEIWKLNFGAYPTIGQKVIVNPKSEYANEWPGVWVLAYISPSRYRGAEFTIVESLENTQDGGEFYAEDILPVPEETTPLEYFAGQCLQVIFSRCLDTKVEWADKKNNDFAFSIARGILKDQETLTKFDFHVDISDHFSFSILNKLLIENEEKIKMTDADLNVIGESIGIQYSELSSKAFSQQVAE